jgi:TonB family protein
MSAPYDTRGSFVRARLYSCFMLYDEAEKVPRAISAGALPIAASARRAAAPRLELAWEERRHNFVESWHALWREPRAPREFHGDPYFRDCWVSGRAPRGAFLAALGWHAVLVALLIPLWNIVVARPVVVRQYTQITWYGPVNDLPLILPAAPRVKAPTERPKASVREPVPAPVVQRGADAFHPRQTILNAPRRPNHPRQTLIQPDSAPVPPTILPDLPNIVAWNTPGAPALKIDPAELARLEPKIRRTHLPQDVAAPDVANPLSDLAAIDIAAPEPAIARPTLPAGRLSPRAKAGRTNMAADEVAAPEVNTPDSGGTRLIALSATPAPVAPPAVPAGNLSSRVAISPDGAQPGMPVGNSGTAKSEAGSGPPGLSITGGAATSSVSDVSHAAGADSTTALPGRVNRATAAKNAAEPSTKSAGAAPEIAGKSVYERIKSGVAPEALLGLKHVYTLHVNMPNLTSASGSWILSFAELAAPEAQPNAYTNPADLAAPEPLRKVDPKYPPELRKGHVEGEVVLYAVIRADGTVDSIQLVSGIDPELNANAMQALAQWKFRPAERKGEAIDLEAIVHVPFRGAPGF